MIDRHDRFTLSEGVATLTQPAKLKRESLLFLQEWMELMLRRVTDAVAKIDEAELLEVDALDRAMRSKQSE